MKKFVIQIIIIAFLSILVGLGFNQFIRKPPLPLFSKFQPSPSTQPGTNPGNEDFSKYYQEMNADTLSSLLETDMIVLLDARTPDKYLANHIKKAISLPISQFASTYPGVAPLLTKDKSLVLYCIGVDCHDSSLLAKELYQKGHREIFVYKGGIEEWQSLGYPTESQ